MFYEVENKGNMIAGVIGYDSIRKHLAECDYHTAEIREKYYLWRADVYIDYVVNKNGGIHMSTVTLDNKTILVTGARDIIGSTKKNYDN